MIPDLSSKLRALSAYAFTLVHQSEDSETQSYLLGKSDAFQDVAEYIEDSELPQERDLGPG